MRIQHNIAALNSHRQLTSNNNSVSKSLEKLSSGFRINRAGDDAAGLAISEKMRAQITGLETAQKNANDGISLIQTAEGALTEVHSMLNRMVELADQSANGVYDNDTDRANLQKELNSLKDEINRISEGTNFNGINLLDGSLGGGSNKVAPKISASWATAPGMTEVAATADTYTGGEGLTDSTPDADGNITVSGTSNMGLQTGAKGTEGSFSIQYTDTEGNTKTATVKFANGTTAANVAANLASAINKDSNLGGMFTASVNAKNGIDFTAKEKGTNAPKITKAGNYAFKKTDIAKGVDAGVTLGANMNAGDSLTVDGKTYTVVGGTTTNAEKGMYKDVTDLIKQLKADGYKVVDPANDGAELTTSVAGTIIRDPKASGKGLTLQIGDTADSFNQLTVSVGNMSAKSLGIGNIDISTQQGGKDAVQLIKDAINSVSSTRGDLGALQNRLEHTINNLNVSAENMTAAESRIRDVDMAKEMMTYTKNNILVQSSQAMLAQANQLPQGVLQLLQ